MEKEISPKYSAPRLESKPPKSLPLATTKKTTHKQSWPATESIDALKKASSKTNKQTTFVSSQLKKLKKKFSWANLAALLSSCEAPIRRRCEVEANHSQSCRARTCECNVPELASQCPTKQSLQTTDTKTAYEWRLELRPKAGAASAEEQPQ